MLNNFLAAIKSEVSKIEDSIKSAFGGVSENVALIAAWTIDDLKAAEHSFVSGIAAEAITIASAFEAGANWAASRVHSSVAQVTASAAATVIAAVPSDPTNLPVSGSDASAVNANSTVSVNLSSATASTSTSSVDAVQTAVDTGSSAETVETAAQTAVDNAGTTGTDGTASVVG